MKILTTKQLRKADEYTIKYEPIASLDLMERAAQRLSQRIMEIVEKDTIFYIFCGNGNNGGDGLAIARFLILNKYKVEVFVPDHGVKFSEDCGVNLNRFKNIGTDHLHFIKTIHDIPTIPGNVVVLDALFGSGLDRPVEGIHKSIIEQINLSGAYTIAIDVPSGLMGEDNSQNNREAIVKADLTITIELPKLSFFFADNYPFVGQYEVVSIDLNPEFIHSEETPFEFLDHPFVHSLLMKRPANGHKGSFGHALLFSGSYGKMGAAVLSSKAILASGAGLLTTAIPKAGYSVLQSAFPEAMVVPDESETHLSQAVSNIEKYSSVGIGPGIGVHPDTQKVFKLIIQEAHQPLVIDADAINILSEQKTWLSFLPQGSILTPHPGEFDRLTHKHLDGYSRMLTQLELSKRHGIYIVLKGMNTSVSTPDGKLFFNTTGNSGMATAGSGDVLTGIITGLLAQGYSPLKASLIGVYLHGLAGDKAAFEKGEHSLIASDIIQYMGYAFRSLE